jgi:hypothetical protein
MGSDGACVMNLKSIAVAGALLLASVSTANALTINIGDINDGQDLNLGSVNLSTDPTGIRFDGGILNGDGSFSVNVFVNPFLAGAFATANILLENFVGGAENVQGSFGGIDLNLQKIGTTWLMLTPVAVAFAGIGEANGKVLTISWENADDDQLSVRVAPVPVPAAALFLLSGLGGLGFLGRYRMKSAKTA